ncbi:MAG TPA: cbb3-type cytochrome c oxidase N-terminal domain-containing protein [Opitutaceae bacterium]
MSQTQPPPSSVAHDDQVREHSFDGIQEYDKRLPNWWLATFYGAIVFWVGFWFYYERGRIGPDNVQRLEQQMAAIEAARLASAPAVDDASLWKMSRNAVFVDAGRTTFATTCASCHADKLTGGIGPNLVDKLWIHGGTPTEVYRTITDGVLVKGMPAWGPVLGAKKVSEVAAYILSYHQEGEPVEKQEAWTPIAPQT